MQGMMQEQTSIKDGLKKGYGVSGEASFIMICTPNDTFRIFN